MLSESVLIDTSAFAALFDSTDQYHAACRDQFQQLPVGKSYTCWPVVTEALYLARRYPRQQDQLLNALAAGDFILLLLDEQDIVGIPRVLRKYQDQTIDFADAVLAHLAVREEIDVVFTLDRRHFEILRSSGGKSFRLLPDLA